jgi:hypothetical protein
MCCPATVREKSCADVESIGLTMVYGSNFAFPAPAPVPAAVPCETPALKPRTSTVPTPSIAALPTTFRAPPGFTVAGALFHAIASAASAMTPAPKNALLIFAS